MTRVDRCASRRRVVSHVNGPLTFSVVIPAVYRGESSPGKIEAARRPPASLGRTGRQDRVASLAAPPGPRYSAPALAFPEPDSLPPPLGAALLLLDAVPRSRREQVGQQLMLDRFRRQRVGAFVGVNVEAVDHQPFPGV